MNILLLSLYRYLIAPTATVFLPLIALFEPKVRLGLRLRRKSVEPLARGGDNPIWIHAASGEFEYAKAVIREIKTQNPKIPIVVTYFSPSFAKAVQTFAGVDRALPLPLDLPGPTTGFLKKMHPRALLLARTDLWPEMLEQCKKRKIPIILFSYTQKDFHSKIKKYFTRWALHWTDQIYCVSELDRENLNVLKLSAKIDVIGDTRYDQVAFRLSHGASIPEILRPTQELLCFVAGSTWPEDEVVLLPALANALLKRKIKLILVPHEPTLRHLEELECQLDSLALTYSRYSSEQDWSEKHVLIVDKLGVLADLYQWADLAFVGGSFRKSVHSVMEALGAGCYTFVGPYHQNNREALEFQKTPIGSSTGLHVVNDTQELSHALEEILEAPQTMLATYSEILKNEFSQRMGASQRLVNNLKSLLQ